MKIGLCTYNFTPLLESGRAEVEDMFRFAKEHDVDYLEISDFTFDVYSDGMPERLKDYSEKYGVEIGGLNFSCDIARAQSDEVYEEELEKLKKKVDIAHEMGATISRCDFAKLRPISRPGSVEEFDLILPGLVRAAKDLCDYALKYDYYLASENHGILLNGSDRLRRMVKEVDKPNYCITMDIVNGYSAGEDPLVLVEEVLPFARRIHVKDAYFRSKAEGPAIGAVDLQGNVLSGDARFNNGWIPNRYGDFFRPAIFGHGDVPAVEILEKIVHSDYDGKDGMEGHLSIEFEGLEDPYTANILSLRNLRQILEMVRG